MSIAGDVVGGDQTKRTSVAAKHSSIKEVAGQVLSADIEKIRSVYVQTASYTRAQRILEDKRILILWGDSRLGKRTAAIHLLLSLLHVEDIFEIDPGVEDLNSFQCGTEQTYIIDTFVADSVGKINSYFLNGLSQQFSKQNSHLVITIDSRVQISQESLDGYILIWSDLPESSALLERHLAWHLKDQATIASSRTLTQTDSVLELLNNNLLPGDIDELAKLLAKVVRKVLTLDEALARFSVRAYQQVKSWFESEQDLSQYAFMITLAVLSGSNYQAVDDASQRLQSIIKPSLEKEEASDSESLLARRSQRVKKVCAHLVKGYESTEFGRSLVELIELNNPAFQPAVLSYVWHEYDRLREPLLIWLHELGFHHAFEVRLRAAAAVGELSKYAFKNILDKVLRPWANCQEQRVQKLAALSLSIPVFESDLAPQVLGLLHSWSRLKNNLSLRWTATAAYGSYVGQRFPDAALRNLLAIAKSGDAFLFPAVVESVVSLFESG